MVFDIPEGGRSSMRWPDDISASHRIDIDLQPGLGNLSKDASMVEQLRFTAVSAAARRLLAAEGESGRFEFKRTSDAVKPDVLVAAANWVALSPGLEEVTILVGVAEVTDPVTRLTTGVVAGLKGPLAGHIERVNNQAKNTFPVPVELTVIEEAVETQHPFLRVKVRPTAAPHFDGSGRRVTRYGASTRRLEDQELLDLYLDREAERFRARFQSIADGLEERLESLSRMTGAAVEAAERLPGLISNAESAASLAGAEAEDSKRSVEDLARDVDRFRSELLTRLDRSPTEVVRQLRYERQRVWAAFCIDRVQRPSKAAERVATSLQDFLQEALDVDNVIGNQVELEAWRRALDEENAPAPAVWWKRTLAEVRREAASAGLPLELPDWTTDIAKMLAEGMTAQDIQIAPWPGTD